MAGRSRIGPAIRCLSGCPSVATGLYEAEETARWTSNPPTEKNNQASFRRAHRGPHNARRVCDRVRVLLPLRQCALVHAQPARRCLLLAQDGRIRDEAEP